MSLNKAGEYWWSAVLEGEEPIDIDQINKERSMATVDEEEHAVLDRLTFDYHQKLQGKPQSHELVHLGLQCGGGGLWGTGREWAGRRCAVSMGNLAAGQDYQLGPDLGSSSLVSWSQPGEGSGFTSGQRGACAHNPSCPAWVSRSQGPCPRASTGQTPRTSEREVLPSRCGSSEA